MLLCSVHFMLAALFPEASFAFSGKSPVKKKPGLFGTIEFKSSLKAFGLWTRVLHKGEDQVLAFASCGGEGDACSKAARTFNYITAKLKGEEPMEQLRRVNRFFNKWPYRLDMELYGMSDYWATPKEFIGKSGDCEDYSIIKYFALKKLGISQDQMRIVILKDYIRNVGHAVLAVYVYDDIYILDNLSDLVLSHKKFKHYIPLYSVSEKRSWAHIKPVKSFNLR